MGSNGASCLFATDPPPIIINDTTTHYLLGSNFSLLKDKEKKLTIRDIISPAFKQVFVYNEKQRFNFGHANAAYWIKFKVKNATSAKIDLFLEIDYHLIDKIDLYILQKNNTFIVKKSGDQIPFHQREIHHRKPLFRLTLNAHQQQTYYLKAENNGGTLNLPISFWVPEAHTQKDYKEQYILGIYYGVLAIVLLINLFLFRTLRDRTYLYYVLYIFWMVIAQLSLDGFAFQYFWPNFSWLSNHIIPLSACLSYCFFIKFAQSFLHSKYYQPKIDKLLSIILVLVISILFISLLNNPFYALSTVLIDFIIPIIGIIILIAAISSLKTNFRVNVYFLSGFLILLIGVNAFILKENGKLPGFFLTDYAMHLGTSLEAIMLSFALAVRFKVFKEEKERAQVETVLQLTKMNKLKDQLNKELEQKVLKRTKEIKHQKDIIEQKNEDIIDSIRYAKKIQAAIMPPIAKVQKVLPDSFILYKPRDIVSGDFYWFGSPPEKEKRRIGETERRKTKRFTDSPTHPFPDSGGGRCPVDIEPALRDGGLGFGGATIIIAACDCTGHGVPGAFMSMIGNTLLNEIVKDKHITQPNLILDHLHQSMVAELRQSEDASNVSDGMDIALCTISPPLTPSPPEKEKRGIGETERKKTKQFTDSPIHPFTDSVRNSGGGDLEGASLQYAGAYRPLFLVRNGELSEIKGDRFSIGGLQIDRKRKFTNHTLDIQKGDSIYIFTDGFVDQFGGVKGKRFMSKRFKEFLQDIQDVNIREQGKVLDETIEKWRGNEEQIDDILVIGIRF